MSNLLRPPDVAVDGETDGAPVTEIRDPQQPRAGSNWRPFALSGLVYLVVSLFVWTNLWSRHPTSTTICGCGDPSLFTWFLAWPAHAILHGENPFYSTALFHPGGVNLLSNTSELAIGLILAPVTWLFGPIATLNVAIVLTPIANALAMWALLRRWTEWPGAAFIGGLAYGFAPFLLLNLTGGYFMISTALVPPLVLLCLDELLIRQRRSPVLMGVVLGLLVVFEFFIGTEALLIFAISLAIGLVLFVGYSALRTPAELRSHLHHAVIGVGWWAGTSVVLLAYPLWFALAGPAHLSGAIWPNLSLQYGGSSLKKILFTTPAQTTGFAGSYWNHGFGNYQGPVLSTQYFGLGLFLVLIAGVVLFRRDRRIWLFTTMTALTLLLSFGASKSITLPWPILAHLPQFENIIPERFLAITWLTTSILLALILDHTYREVDRWSRNKRAAAASAGTRPDPLTTRWSAALAAVLVALVALVQPAVYMSQNLPFTAVPVTLPTWFQQVGPHLDEQQVVLVIPSPGSLRVSAATWQAVDSMAFSMVEGPGPGSVPSRQGSELAGATVLSELSSSLTFEHTFEHGTATQSAAPVDDIRTALHGWGVTTVVIPDQTDLPGYTRIPSVTLAAALVTAATGEKPLHQADAWVWTDVQHAVSNPSPATDLVTCVNGLPIRGVGAVEEATDCALGRPR